jgi:DNA primase
MMQTWVDFAAIKQSVPLAPLLRRYQVKLRRSGRDPYRGCCPIHGGQGQDAFHAHLTRNIFHCFSGGAGGTVLDFVAAMDGCSLREAALKLTRETAMGGVAPAAGRSQLVTERRKPLSPLGFTLRGVDSAHPYLAARGIDRAMAEQFGMGFYRGPGIFGGRLVIPLHNGCGELVAYGGRAVDGAQPRYRFPSGFAKSEILFNLHRAVATGRQAVVVVEGFFELYQAGEPAVVGLMGAALYEPQQRSLLQHFQHVILLLDGDPAGRLATANLTSRLRPHTSVEVIHLPDGVQPDQLSTEALRGILHSWTCSFGDWCDDATPQRRWRNERTRKGETS